MSARCLDFHTHLQAGVPPSDRSVYSVSLTSGVVPNAYHTVGVHPWDTERCDARRLVESVLADALSHSQCLGVGEVGLDRLRGAALGVQGELFEAQLRIAASGGRSVVIHCVRAWSELLASVRRSCYSGHLALHGFQGHCPMLGRLLDGGWFISVKPLRNGSLPAEVRLIPEAQLLLETDGMALPIEEVYAQAAELRGVSVVELSHTVARNVAHFFNAVI